MRGDLQWKDGVVGGDVIFVPDPQGKFPLEPPKIISRQELLAKISNTVFWTEKPIDERHQMTLDLMHSVDLYVAGLLADRALGDGSERITEEQVGDLVKFAAIKHAGLPESTLEEYRAKVITMVACMYGIEDKGGFDPDGYEDDIIDGWNQKEPPIDCAEGIFCNDISYGE